MLELTVHWAVLIADASIKVLVVAGATGLLLAVGRIRNSSVKHAAWMGVLSAFILLPMLSMTLPAVSVPTPGWLSTQITSTSSDFPAVASGQFEGESAVIPSGSSSPHTVLQRQATEQEPGGFDSTIRTGELSPEIRASGVNRTEKSVLNPVPFPMWLPMIVAVWVLGALVMLTRLGLSTAITCRLVHRSAVISPRDLRLSYSQAERLNQNTNERVVLRESPLVFVPMTTGWWQPSILLPIAWHTWSPDKLQHVLDHERTHLRRGDNWTALVAEITTCLYWFHPLSWWLRRQLSALAEECCDDAAIGVPENRAAYARHLLEIASELNGQPRRLHYAGLAMTRHSQVERRILAILDTSRPLSQRLSRSATLLVFSMMVPVLAVSAMLEPTPATTAEHRDVDKGAPESKAKPDKPEVAKDPAAKPSPTNSQDLAPRTLDVILIRGRATAANQPAVGAFVAILGESMTIEHGMMPVTLAEGTTDQDGRFELTVPGESAKVDVQPRLLASFKGHGLAWQTVDFDLIDSQINLEFQPEKLIKVRFVDAQGRPASGLAVDFAGIGPSNGTPPSDRTLWLLEMNPAPKAIPTFVSDKDGYLTIPHIAVDHGVHLQIRGNEKFAPQLLALNTGMAESRTASDGTYRPFVKNLQPDEIAVIPLAPATLFEGVVRLGKTGKPAAHVKMAIWSSQQESGGSMVALHGKADANGHFRLNPYPGVRFGIDAFPPAGTSYQIHRRENLKWESGPSQKLEIQLTSSILAHGTVVDADTGKPLAKASVQYHPEQANKNVSDDLVTGWQSIQQTDENGRFQIPVVAGAGTLLVHAPLGTSYVLQQRGSRELATGQPGGIRYYAHAFQKIDPAPYQPGAEPSALEPLSIRLQPGGTVTAKLVDPAGKPIKVAVYTSRLFILPTNPFWRAFSEEAKNGQVVIRGLEPGQKYPVFFLDVQQKLGAKAMISLEDPNPVITLRPCASAKARYLTLSGQPVKQGLMFGLNMLVTEGKPKYTLDPAQRELLEADEDISSNFDRAKSRNHAGTNENGIEHYQLLIPGTTYRFLNLNGGKVTVEKGFIAKAGEIHELGDISVNLED